MYYVYATFQNLVNKWQKKDRMFKHFFLQGDNFSGLGIFSFAHFTQIKWVTVSDLLRSLKTNERPLAIFSGRSEEMSKWAIHSKNVG